jgi:Zn-dependent M28 family amino/carboxypeptidase
MRLALLATALLLAASANAAETRIPDRALEQAAQLRDRALADDTGWKVTESLTTEVGPRMAGSEADARAVAWAVAKFRELGFDRVWTEPVTFPKWERRSESAAVLGAHAQPLKITALGGSPAGTVEGEVVRFADLAALEAAPEGSLAGRIAFVDYHMPAARDGSGYGKGSAIRSKGPSAAIRKGASGFLMRSAGTDSHRVPHTGITRFDEGLTPVPSAALSVPDAEQLARLVARGPVKVRLAIDAGWDGSYTSQNVIGEITGRSKPKEVVLIGGHLDSWDLGTGAIDDAAGVGITMAAARLIAQMPKRPARSIRVVAFANEEQGLHGGKAYAVAHAADVGRHQLSAESDFGAGRIYAFNTGAPEHARAATQQIAQALAPLGIEYAADKGGAGPDIGPLAAKGATWAWLAQDGTDYFNLHHTADDTLDKIDPAALAQNVAAYAVFAYLAAEAEGDFGSAPKQEAPKPAH